MKKKWISGIFFTHIFISSTFSQTTGYPMFTPPLQPPLSISGGYGEIRTNHIHSGMDLRTGGEIGKTVYAAGDGFISRIKVEPGGFGKAIYIDHPNGYTTVYAHLDAFRDDITEYVRKQQYDNQLFPIDVFPKKTDFIIKRGDSIAYSGNSGGSEGPHLHFEIRETVKQSPQQPLLFNIPLTDTKAPSFYSLTAYPLDAVSTVAGKSSKVSFQVTHKNGDFTLNPDRVISFSGNIGFGAEVFDAVDSSAGRTGFYRLMMKVDSTIVYVNEISSFGFSESRYVNSMIDYAEYMKSRKKITKLYVDPNNKLSTFKTLINKGILNIKDTLVHSVEITASDVNNNTSNLSFQIRYQENTSPNPMVSDSCNQYFSYMKENNFTTNNFKLFIPLNALYKDLCLKFSEKPKKIGYFSRIYQVGDSSIPFQFPLEISIKPENLPPALQKKAIVVRLDNNNPNSIGGAVENGYIKGKTYILGNFALTVDTTPPRILPHKGFTTNYQGIKRSYITFRISDNLSGISTYKGFINGKWALFEYDLKNGLLVHQIDESRFQYNTKTNIRIEVSDSKDNTATFETKYRPNM